MLKNKIKKKILFFLLFFLTVISCNSVDEKPQSIKKEKISGLVQKGPFVSGTTVTMNELNSDLGQTGKVFTSTIVNDLGLFEVNNIELISGFVRLTSTGFYFNEVTGELSIAPLTLTSLSDVKDKNSININVLTHLEQKRVETLIKEGKPFSESKTQSRNELLSVFSMALSTDVSFEEFDISKNKEEGGILLAISIILQGNRSVGELTELLSRIQNDFSDNGKLDDGNVLNSIRLSTLGLDFKEIRGKIERRFKELNSNSNVPDFEKQVAKFLSYKDYSLKITIEGEGEVVERVIPNPSGKEYPYNTIVELTPKPKEGWVFDSWGGDLGGNESPKKITVDKEKNVSVKFKSLPVFRLSDNGITCICEHVKAGDKGLINGIEYEAVDNSLLRIRRNQRVDMTKLCTSLVTDLSRLYNQDYFQNNFNQPIGNWDVSNVVTMQEMFVGSPFNQDISKWDVRKVINMGWMFQSSSFNQPIGNWDVKNVSRMNVMFMRTPFNQPLSNWNVSSVTNMSGMFAGTPFNQPIGNWNVSSVNNMSGMFALTPFNQPIGNWNVSNVTNMGGMFEESSFNQNISKWCVFNIISEPPSFSTNSPLISGHKPKWGTCPN